MRWAATLGLGALIAVAGSGAAAPAEDGGQRLAATDAPLARAFYHVRITYEGLRQTQQNTLVGGALFRTERETRADAYVATTTKPVRLIAHCVGPHVRWLPRGMRNAPGPCASIRKRALAGLTGANRERFVASYFSGAAEAYQFGGRARSIKLEGQVEFGLHVDKRTPIQRARRGQGGLVTVTCSPESRIFYREMLSPQDGLVIRLVSGNPKAARNATNGIRRTTHGGLVLSSSIVGGPGVAQARVEESVTSHVCPGVNGGEETVIPGVPEREADATWFPTDRVFTTDPRSGLVGRMAFEKSRVGKLGNPFDDLTILNKRRGARPQSSLPQVLKDRHRWKLNFFPCPKPKSPGRCPAPKGA